MTDLNATLAQPQNSVAQAYQARSTQLDTQAKATQTQQDNAMLKAFEYAGDGKTEEATLYAKQNNLQLPPEVLSNSDFAKGLSLAGKLYGSDPAAAQKFTSAWMQNRGGDLQTRVQAAAQAAGTPINPEDRKFQQTMALEAWKKQLEPPDISRFKAGQDAYNDDMKSGLSNATSAENSRQAALTNWDHEYANKGVSPGLMGNIPDFNVPGVGTSPPISVRNNNPGNMRPVGATSGFQHFNTPQAGLDAMKQDLAAKIGGQSQAMAARFGQGYSPTLANVAETWAPPEENNTAQYTMQLSQITGIGPNQVLTLADIDKVSQAMTQLEGGSAASSYFSSANPGAEAPQGAQPSPEGLQQQGLYAVQKLLMNGHTPHEIRIQLIQRGADPEKVNSMLQSAGAN